MTNLERTGVHVGAYVTAKGTLRLVVKDCGKHWGITSGPCRKCAYFAKLQSDPNYHKTHQHNGTPWIAVLGPPSVKR